MTKRLTLSLLLTLVYSITLVQSDSIEHANPFFEEEAEKFPCSYFNTINITGGVYDPVTEAVTHKDVTYQLQQYSEYDYIINEVYKKVTVPKHLRGCVCRYKTCVRLCCEPGHHFIPHRTVCEPVADAYTQFLLNVTTSSGDVSERDIYDDSKMAYVVGKPCTSYFLDSEQGDDWTLHANGSLIYFDEVLDQNRYCLAYYLNEFNESSFVNMQALYCDIKKVNVGSFITPYAMLVSVPFLLLTFGVYAWLRELRATLHGKSLMCYVFMLAIGYLILAIVQLNGQIRIDHGLCITYGYIIQGSFTASFLWLSVISFDIWWTFGKGGDHSGRRFLKYSIYAWGLTTGLLSFVVIMDNVPGVPGYLRPKIGEDHCWLQKGAWVQFIFLYLPILLIVTINSIFFGMTANKIRLAQKASAAALTKGDSRKHSKVQSEKEKFSLFFRLFIIMGVTWSMEFISWALDSAMETHFFIVTDLCNSIQGILIFVLFVCKPRVKALAKKRYYQLRGIPLESTTHASRTSTTAVSLHQIEKQSLKRNGVEH